MILLIISTIGTAAMLWVGGSIMVHGIKDLGFPQTYDTIHQWAEIGAHSVTAAQGFVEWVIVAALDGVIGLAWGLLLIPVVAFAINPALKAVTSKGQ
jgi:hypothetical protein